MKRIALFLAFALLLCCGCEALPAAGTPAPEAAAGALELTPAPESPALSTNDPAQASATAVEGVSSVERTVFYPEGTDESTAQFRLTYTLPQFEATHAYADAYNAALSLYEEELLERVVSERLPYADAADGFVPYTRIETSVEECRDFINIFMYEYTSFDAAEGEELLPRVLVFTDIGERASLYTASRRYDADALAAQQVFNLIDANRSAYYGDITLDDIPSALDLYSGFFITEEGYALVAAPGALASAAEGESVFLIDREAFYPDAVGDVLSISEYEALSAPLDLLAAAVGQDYAGFTSGAPDAFTASAFMTLSLTTGHEEELYTAIDAASYESEFYKYFAALPSDVTDTDINDGTFIEGGSYMLPVHPHPYWSLRIDEAVRTENGLVLYGMIMLGTPGTSDAGELCAATFTLVQSDASPMGFTFESVELR